MLKSFSFFSLAIVCALTIVSCTKSSSSTDKVGNWKRLGDFSGIPRSGAICAATNDSAYVGLGFDGVNRLRDFWVFDVSQGQWIKRDSFPGPGRNNGMSFSVNGKIYAGFGWDGGTFYYKDFYMFDPAVNKWTRLADFPGSGRYMGLGFSMNGKGYICSGNDGNTLQELWQFDPGANTWTQMNNLPGYKRQGAVAFVINNLAYVVTGTGSGGDLNDMWALDPTGDGGKGTWIKKRSIANVSDSSFDDLYSTITRAYAVAFVMGGKAELATGISGGNNSTNNNVKVWEYDPAADQWTEKTSFEGTPRAQAVGFTLKGRGFLTTGQNGKILLDDVREWRPNDVDNTTDD